MNAALVAALCGLLFAPPSTDASAVDNDPVLRAMQDELTRSKALSLPESPAPYYVAYSVIDTQTIDVDASFGALMETSEGRTRMIVPTVRAGSYERDAVGYPMSDGIAPFEDDYDAIRRRLWLATDGAYKSAATNFREQQAQDKQSTRDEDAPDSYSQRPSIVHVEAPGTSTLDRSALEKIAKAASKVFREFPEIQHSAIAVDGAQRYRRFASSEGSVVAEGGALLSVMVVAGGQAQDGSPIRSVKTVQTMDGTVPSEAQLVAVAREVAADFMALRQAPALADYTGPLLLEGRAAAQITAHMLGARFSAGGWGNDLEARMGQRVLPKGYALVDDPTLTSFEGRPLYGHYAIDEEGVPGQRITLVEDGRLEGLMSTRQPTKKHPQSNGHARGGAMGWTSPAPSNLILRSKAGVSDAALDKMLRAQMKREGLDFGIVITDVGASPWSPAEAYRVDAKGTRQRVRLGNMESLELRAFRDILGAGKSLHQFDFLAMGGQPVLGAPSEMLGFAAPTSVLAPSLLLREAVVHKDEGDKPTPPLYTHPSFVK